MAYVKPALSMETLLLAKLETTIGTDVTPDAANDVMLIDGDPSLYNLDIRRIATNPITGSMTKNSDIIGRKLPTLTFDIFIQGAGGFANNGTKPFWLTLAEACGHTVASDDDGNSSSWQLTPTNEPASLSMYVHTADVLRKVLGAFGNMTFNFPAGDAPRANCTFTGLYSSPEAATFPASPTVPTLYAKQVESEGLDLNGYTPIAANATFRLGAVQNERENINAAEGFEGLFHADRTPELDVTLEAEEGLPGGFNPWSILENGTLGDVTWTHGNDADGSKTVFLLNSPQLVGIREQNGNGRKQYVATYKARNTTKNGDYSITHHEGI